MASMEKRIEFGSWDKMTIGGIVPSTRLTLNCVWEGLHIKG